MSIITISRGSYAYGKEVAEKVAKKLGFECIGREVILEASKTFNIPEIKLTKAIEEAPSFLERFTRGKQRYVAYIQAAVLRHMKKDNVVYHGFAGHYFVKDIPHVLKVRITANIEKRVQILLQREQILSRENALKFIKKIDEERTKWSSYMYGIDTHDPSLYDLVLSVDRYSVDDLVEVICHTVKFDRFKTTPESQKMMDDLVLAAEVKAAIAEVAPTAEVSVSDGIVKVKTKASRSLIMEIASNVEGIKDIIFE